MIQITNDYLPDTRKIWAAGDSKIITISHALLKLLDCKKGDYVQFFMKKAEVPIKEEPKEEITPTTMQPTPEKLGETESGMLTVENEPKDQESRPEVPDMPV